MRHILARPDRLRPPALCGQRLPFADGRKPSINHSSSSPPDGALNAMVLPSGDSANCRMLPSRSVVMAVGSPPAVETVHSRPFALYMSRAPSGVQAIELPGVRSPSAFSTVRGSPPPTGTILMIASEHA